MDPEEAALRERLGIESDQALLTVSLVGEGAVEALVPDTLTVAPGDVVVFETGDWRVHTLYFDTLSMSPGQRGFLRESGQTASPPLVTRGSRFVVTFVGAPEGEYPFVSEAGGGDAGGIVRVRSPEGRR
jgi:plastocyanin